MKIKIEATVSMVWASHGRDTFGLWAESGPSTRQQTQMIEVSSTLEHDFKVGDKITITVEKKGK